MKAIYMTTNLDHLELAILRWLYNDHNNEEQSTFRDSIRVFRQPFDEDADLSLFKLNGKRVDVVFREYREVEAARLKQLTDSVMHETACNTEDVTLTLVLLVNKGLAEVEEDFHYKISKEGLRFLRATT